MKIKPILKIESHPFFIGPISPETSLNIPPALPFYLGIHPKYAVPVLILTDDIRKALADAYSFGSMLSTPFGESSLSRERMYEVLDKLLYLFDGKVEKAKFLEIGCGSGALLNELKIRGAKVTGIEIGPQGQEAAKKYGFQVVNKPLAPGNFTEKFDCIFSYGCLEHISELKEFFLASRECLKEGGLFFHSVPNSELYFNSGALGHLAHEHVNYFTQENGIRLFNSQGFRNTQACTSNAGNELFLWGFYDNTVTLILPGENIQFILEEAGKLKKYSNKLNKNIKRIVMVLKEIQSNNQSIGFYAGGYEYSILLKDVDNIRYFDGDSYKHRKSWVQGLPCIESPMALKTIPVDNLIVCKNYYFDAIVNYLVKELNIPDEIKIHKLDNLGL